MTFDPSAFINQSVDGPLSTAYPVVPEGEFKCIVSSDGEIADWFREMKWNDKTTGQPRSAPTCEVPIEVLDDTVRQKMGRDKALTRYRMILDMTADGKLDTSEGKNVKLGQLRNAVGQNATSGWTFAMLRGAGPFMGRVTQTSDKNDPEKKYSEVSRVSKLA